MSLLVPDLALLDAALAGSEELGRALGEYEVAEGWEGFPEAILQVRDAVSSDPALTRWGTRLFLLDEPATLAGWGGFKGPPSNGVVELGYAVAPALQGRGIASAAVREMLREAYAADEVVAVIAHTLPEANASTRVLERTGFVLDSEDAEEDGEPVWRWRHAERPT